MTKSKLTPLLFGTLFLTMLIPSSLGNAFGGAIPDNFYIFTGDGDGSSWSDPANWDVGVPPNPAGFGDVIVIGTDNTYDVVLNGFSQVLDSNSLLEIIGPSTLTIGPSGSIVHSSAETIHIHPDAELIVKGELDNSLGEIVNEGTLTICTDSATFEEGTVSGNPPIFENCSLVGGQVLTMNSSSLIIAGLSSISIWMVPALAVVVGTGIYLAKLRKN